MSADALTGELLGTGGVNIDAVSPTVVPHDAWKNATISMLNHIASIPNNVRNIITIIDFTLPSTSERLWLVDLENNEIMLSSKVTHGSASSESNSGAGRKNAVDFSNTPGSHKSSLGAYVTYGNIYTRDNGQKALRTDGLEPSSSNAKQKGNTFSFNKSSRWNYEMGDHGGVLELLTQ